MTRVVLLTLVPTRPAPSGIGRRLAAVAEALAGSFDLTVVSCLPDSVAQDPIGMQHRSLVRPTGTTGAIAQMGTALARRRPLTTAYYRRPSLRRQLKEALCGLRPEVVVTHGVGGAVLLQGLFPASRTVLDLADAEHQRVGEIGALMGWKGLPYRLDGPRMVAWFRRHLDDFAAVSGVSDADLDSYRALAPTAAFVLAPNGCAVPAHARPDPGSRRLLFLGDLHYPPNSQGLAWFASEVLPHLPDVELRVVGRGDVPECPRLSHAGFVDDLESEWHLATALVVPIRAGGGTRIKVLEAFAAGVPVVSTTLGADGLAADPDVHYLRADTPAEMRTALLRLVADAELRGTLAKAGRSLVADRFVWSECLAPLLAATARAADT